MAGRGLALLHTARGDHAAARDWLDRALSRAGREPDRYQWVHAYVLDAAVTGALARGDSDRARPLATALSDLAARCDLRELLARAYLHLADLGDPQGNARARSLTLSIDSPHLQALLQPDSARS
ncbi:hypothetical protein E1263_11395 [Kribbella antibiotica]|uniref:Uncharacterized protein n=1 Tax=Kribbella antibiotica TaxID=190195 RepID=A0A4R4ZQQ0_9ACTN|nr:hypothetical protein E1263_11395 [Kribbella antibiotica]